MSWVPSESLLSVGGSFLLGVGWGVWPAWGRKRNSLCLPLLSDGAGLPIPHVVGSLLWPKAPRGQGLVCLQNPHTLHGQELNNQYT